jgi:hypothetical protein
MVIKAPKMAVKPQIKQSDGGLITFKLSFCIS